MKVNSYIANRIIAHINGGAKVLLVGNGGSAAIAQHIAAELMVKFNKVRDPIPALALTADTSVLTAHANDFGYITVFARQIEALCSAGDIVIAMTTSGRSQNVIAAIKRAAERGALVLVLTGPVDLEALSAQYLVEYSIIVERSEEVTTARIQEDHLNWLHTLCGDIDDKTKTH